MPTIADKVKSHLRRQIDSSEAQAELREMEKNGVPWRDRVRTTADRLVPFFADHARKVLDKTGEHLNAAPFAMDLLNEGWLDKIACNTGVTAKVVALRKHIQAASSLVANLQSQEVSRELQNVLSEEGLFKQLDLVRTPGSIYPDLVFRDYDYSMLPKSSRAKKIEGPNLKRNGVPSNVPDGCELKTNEGFRIHVDAHAPHPGLHLAVTWSHGGDGRILMGDIWMGYIRKCDYTHGNRNVEATTVKYSFGHASFVSLTRGA